MSDTPRSLGRTLWALVLALLNATLILLALCLWLGWKMVSEARAIGSGLTSNLALLQPLQSEVSDLRGEVSGLRADLAALRGQAGQSEAVGAVTARIAALDDRIGTTTDRIDELLADPGVLVDRAVDRAALQIKEGIATCAMPTL